MENDRRLSIKVEDEDDSDAIYDWVERDLRSWLDGFDDYAFEDPELHELERKVVRRCLYYVSGLRRTTMEGPRPRRDIEGLKEVLRGAPEEANAGRD